MAHILIVEDDQGVREALEVVLDVQQYTVTGVDRGEDGLEAVANGGIDLVVLDLNLPGIDGVETCKRLRSNSFAGPVLMLTARHEVADRISGLNAGADDYLPKPFALAELLARIRALLRAFDVAETNDDDADLVTLGDCELNPLTRRVTRDGEDIELTKIEFDLLEHLLSNKERVLLRHDIGLAVWGYDDENSSNSLEVFISGLRKKLEHGGKPRLIHTKRGVGYVARLDS